MLSPSLISGTPFRNPTAFNDLVGTVYLMHVILSDTIARSTGQPVPLLPIGDGKIGDKAWLDALTRQIAGECAPLGLTPPASYSEFDLRDPSEFASFTFALSQDLERVRQAAGVN